MSNLPILPFILGVFVNMVVGALWYSNVLFAKPWMREAGITADYIEISKGKMGKVYIFTTIGALLTSFLIGLLVIKLGIDSILHAIIFAIILWLGTNLPTIIKRWGFEDRTVLLGIINHGYDLVVYIIISIVYVIMS